MKKSTKNKVFIAISIDGYIADNEGETDWLHSIPNPEMNDMGYTEFMSSIDAIVMGRNTFEVVKSFDFWPYQIPVFVLSSSIKEVPNALQGKVQLLKGKVSEIIKEIYSQGYYNLYIDGGATINQFLEADAIDEMTITIIPYILGGGTPLFRPLTHRSKFKCIHTQIFLNQVVQNVFVRNSI